MIKTIKKWVLFAIYILVTNNIVFAKEVPSCNFGTISVMGHAQDFLFDSKIKNADITLDMYNKPNQTMYTKTDTKGKFSFCVAPGSIITLTFAKASSNPFNNYITTQSETLLVPQTGIRGEHDEITFQVPTMIVYKILKSIITTKRGITIEGNTCQVVTTISRHDVTLHDDNQGLEGSIVLINGNMAPFYGNEPYYFGILAKQTWPFSSGLISTSKDGGVLIYNIPASNQIQTLGAYKEGMIFSETHFICKDGAFINISPPRGPHVLF